MDFWRDIVRDKWSGGVVYVVLIVTLLAQAALVGSTAAAMAGPDPLSIICTASADGVHGPTDPVHRKDCPCSQLCGAGVHLQTALAPGDGVGLPIRFAARIERIADRSVSMPAGPVVRPYHATGPPPSLV